MNVIKSEPPGLSLLEPPGEMTSMVFVVVL